MLGPVSWDGECASCRKRDGTAYRFWFTSKWDEEETDTYVKNTYLRPSRGHVALCNVCLIQERVRTFLLCIAFTLPVIAYELEWADWDFWDIVVIALWGLGIFGVLGMVSALVPGEAISKAMGSSMALHLAKPVLKKLGC